MSQLFIVKIGGNVIDDEEALSAFLKDFSAINARKLLVHGGGKIATNIGKALGLQPNYVDGRRITDHKTLDLVTMVYGGLINKQIVAALQSFECNAMGITGADANLIPAIKRPVKEIDYGWVGDPEVNIISADAWRDLLEMNITPVVAPLTHDGRGHMLNTNADTIATVLAIALQHIFDVSLIYCFEKKGVLADVNREDSLIDRMDRGLYEQLQAEHKLFAGILPKLKNAFEAKEAGVKDVIIGHSDDLQLLIENRAGTLICN